MQKYCVFIHNNYFTVIYIFNFYSSYPFKIFECIFDFQILLKNVMNNLNIWLMQKQTAEHVLKHTNRY